MLERMDEEVKHIRDCIKRAQNRQKHYYDKTHVFQEFKVGDVVFLKVIHKKSNLILERDRRFSPRFARPSKIFKRVGLNLELPENIKLHPIFHVSLLTSYFANPSHVFQDKYSRRWNFED